MDCLNCQKCDAFETVLWRFECKRCRCPNYNHNSYVRVLMDNNNDLGIWSDKEVPTSISQLGDYRSAMEIARSMELVWLPIGVKKKDIKTFVEMFDDQLGLLANEINTERRSMKIAYQIPISDRNIAISTDNVNDNDVDLESETEYNFKKIRDEYNFGFGELEKVDCDEDCFKCHRQYVDSDKFCVRITHSGTVSWHMSCFQCPLCRDSLADFHYYWDKDRCNVFCMRHFGEISVGRCAGCDKLILSKSSTKAMEKDYHVEHFTCKECNLIMSEGKFLVKDNSPLCPRCYENLFANVCDRCSLKIKCDSKELAFDNRHWHEKCFFCEICKTSLANQKFGNKETELYCASCYEENFSVRCNGCKKPLKSGVKKFEYASKQYHEECFVCSQCKEIIGSKKFIPKDDNILCTQCYEDKYAQKCSKCKQVIRKSGVTYKGEPWHKECFLCTNCNKELANTKFTSKDDKPYCAECFTESFSKRCKKCEKSISGFSGSLFVSLEDGHWHSECFNCERCGMNLVGQGFVKPKLLILCARCGLTNPE